MQFLIQSISFFVLDDTSIVFHDTDVTLPILDIKYSKIDDFYAVLNDDKFTKVTFNKDRDIWEYVVYPGTSMNPKNAIMLFNYIGVSNEGVVYLKKKVSHTFFRLDSKFQQSPVGLSSTKPYNPYDYTNTQELAVDTDDYLLFIKEGNLTQMPTQRGKIINTLITDDECD